MRTLFLGLREKKIMIFINRKNLWDETSMFSKKDCLRINKKLLTGGLEVSLRLGNQNGSDIAGEGDLLKVSASESHPHMERFAL